MKKIDHNLGKVKKNIEYMEDMYEEVFRRINRLISNENHVDAIISFAVESWNIMKQIHGFFILHNSYLTPARMKLSLDFYFRMRWNKIP